MSSDFQLKGPMKYKYFFCEWENNDERHTGMQICLAQRAWERPGGTLREETKCSLIICLHPQTQDLLFFLPASRVWPPLQPYPMCNGGEDPDRSLPLLSGVSDHNWLWFPVHHRGVSCRHCPAHLSAGHHHGDGDLHHWNLSCKGTTVGSYIWKFFHSALEFEKVRGKKAF